MEEKDTVKEEKDNSTSTPGTGKLTVEDLKNVAGGSAGLVEAKAEDAGGNKAEAG